MRMLRLGLFAAMALFCASSQTLGNGAGDAAPRAAFDQFIAAFNSLDWEAFRRCFADSASLFNPDIPDAISLHRMDGRTDIERNFRAVFDAADADTDHKRSPNIHPENVRLQQFGDTIIITFEFKRSEHSTGRRTIVFNKLKGSWLIVHLHASNVTPRWPVSNFAAERHSRPSQWGSIVRIGGQRLRDRPTSEEILIEKSI